MALLPADLRDRGAIAGIVAEVKPDKILHLAAAGVSNPAIDPRLAVEHNVQGTINLLDAAFKNDSLPYLPRQLIVIRTPGEIRPANAYTASKAAAWSFCQMYARRHDWPVTGAMIFQAYGPGQPAHTFIQAALRSALAGQDFAMTSGKQVRDWIFVNDVIEGLLATILADLPPGTSIDLGTGVSTSLEVVAKMVYQLVARGGAPRPGAIPDRPGEEINLAADISRSATMINWRPTIPLSKGLELVFESLVC
jgi:UDP-glucose 4-epimerase